MKKIGFFPKKIFWTNHSQAKMRYWQLSQSRVERVINNPTRFEKGLAPKTIAVMQRVTAKRPYEIWVMFQDSPSKRKIISAWRYPGITKAGEPLPPEIIKEIKQSIKYV
jgi:hypothetical protein